MRLFGWNLLTVIGILSSESFGETITDEDCSLRSKPILKDTSGNGSDFPFDTNALVITGQGVNEVAFSVSQIWNTDGLPMLAVHYRTLDGDDKCSMETMDGDSMIPFRTTKDHVAKCSHGYADVSIYAYVGPKEDFDVSEC